MFNTWQLPIRSDHLIQVTKHHVDLGRWNSPRAEESVGWNWVNMWNAVGCVWNSGRFKNEQQMVGACVGTRMPKLLTVLSDPPKEITTWRILIWRDVFNQSIIKFAFLLLKLFDNDSLDRLICSSSESTMLARNSHVVQTESPVCLLWSRLSEEIPILQLQNIAQHLEVTWSHHHMNPVWPKNHHPKWCFKINLYIHIMMSRI